MLRCNPLKTTSKEYQLDVFLDESDVSAMISHDFFRLFSWFCIVCTWNPPFPRTIVFMCLTRVCFLAFGWWCLTVVFSIKTFLTLICFLWLVVQFNDGAVRWELSDPRSHLDGVGRSYDVNVDFGRRSTASYTAGSSQESYHQKSWIFSPSLPHWTPPLMLLCSFHRRAHTNARRLCQGQRGLEVRGDGAGSFILMDIHVGRTGRHRWDYPASADTLRRSNTNRQKVLGLCIVDNCQVRELVDCSGSSRIFTINLSLLRCPQ